MTGRCRYLAETDYERIARPILVARSGDSVDVQVVNHLPQPTTIHFHGLTLPAAQDGAGFEPIAPGASARLQFVVRNRSGLYWFHPHAHGFTAEQVHAGLVGLLIVHDQDDAAVDRALVLAPGNRHACAINDVRVGNGVIAPYAPSAEECASGWIGERALVNGALEPVLDVAPGWVRLQLLNAGNARGWLLALREIESEGRGEREIPFHLLGTDGGLLPAPIALDRVFVHPAERVDFAFAARAGTRVRAVSLPFEPRNQMAVMPRAMAHPARAGYAPLAATALCVENKGQSAALDTARRDGSAITLLAIQVAAASGAAALPPLPARISELGDAASDAPDSASSSSSSSAAPAARTRRVRLDFDPDAGFVIDQQGYTINEPGWALARGAREIWEIKNSPISMPHPMHLHGLSFRVLRRQGTFGPARALATFGAGRVATDLGVKDTIVVWPNETVWLAIDAALPAASAFAGAQRYLFHCHNLEHEDAMMMRNVVVT